MALWSGIRASRLRSLLHECKKWYTQMPGSTSANCIAGLTRTTDLNRAHSFNHWTPSELHQTVRYFAAPVQAKQKPEKKDHPNGPRLNDQITTEFVRLVTDEGHCIISRHEAIERAGKLKLDLVEVQRTAQPPVCKIMDFHREKYKQQLKEKDRAKSKLEVSLRKGDCKEVRFSAKTEPRDLQMKANMVIRLMEKGYRVKCMAMGTEDQDLGGLLSRLSDLIEDVAVVDSGPRVEKRHAFLIVRHIKFGPSKKGSGKKAASSAEVQQKATSSPSINGSTSIQSPPQVEGEWRTTDSELESDYETTPDEAETPLGTSGEMRDEELKENKITWLTLDANDNFGEVFGSDDNDMNVVASSSTSTRMNKVAGPDSPPEDAATTVSNGRSEPMSRFQPTKPTDSTRSDAKLSTELSKFSSVQRSHVSRASSATSSGHLGRFSSDQVRQPQRDTTASSPTEQKRQEPHPVRSVSPPKNYGIFSSQNPTANSRSSPSNAASRAENSNQKPDSDKSRKEEWGIFSRELSSGNRMGSQAKVQR